MSRKIQSDLLTLLTYKEYYSKVYYSANDEVFFGRIEGIKDSITFEGTTVKELKKAFEKAVDDYLGICNELNKNPEKNYEGSFNIRIGSELHRKLVREAAEEDVSLNNMIKIIIEKHFEK